VRAARGSWKRIPLHHVSYDNLGHEPDQDLVPLCYKDHRNAHRAHQSGRFRDLRAATDEIVKISGRATSSRDLDPAIVCVDLLDFKWTDGNAVV